MKIKDKKRFAISITVVFLVIVAIVLILIPKGDRSSKESKNLTKEYNDKSVKISNEVENTDVKYNIVDNRYLVFYVTNQNESAKNILVSISFLDNTGNEIMFSDTNLETSGNGDKIGIVNLPEVENYVGDINVKVTATDLEDYDDPNAKFSYQKEYDEENNYIFVNLKNETNNAYDEYYGFAILLINDKIIDFIGVDGVDIMASSETKKQLFFNYLVENKVSDFDIKLVVNHVE